MEGVNLMAKQLFNNDNNETSNSTGFGRSMKNAVKNKASEKLSEKASEKVDDVAEKGSQNSGGTSEAQSPVSFMRNKVNDMAMKQMMKKVQPMGNKLQQKADSMKEFSGKMKSVAQKAKTGGKLAATGSKGFAGIYAISKLSKGLHTAFANFMNTQMGQLVEAAYGAYQTASHAVSAGMAVAGTVASKVAAGTSSLVTTAGSIASHAMSALASAGSAVVTGVNAVVNAGAGLFGMAGVASASMVPTAVLTSALVLGGGAGGTAIYSYLSSQDGACLVQAQTASTSSSTSTGAAATGDMQKNAQTVADKLKSAGASGAGIAAYLGNAQHESGIDPTAIQSHVAYDDSKAYNGSLGGYAFGLNQWDSGRRVNLLNYAKSQNKGWTDLNMQLDFALNHDGSDSKVLRSILGKSGSVSDLTEDLRANWERGGVGTTAERQAKAEYWYKTLNLSSVSGNSSLIGGMSDSASSNNDASAEAQAAKNSCNNTASADTDSTDGTGSVSASDNQAWAYNNLPSDVAKYVHKVEDSGLTYGSTTGWANAGGQCVHFSSSYFFKLWRKSDKMPKNVVMVMTGAESAGDWAKAMGGKASSTPKAGAIASVPAYSGSQGDSYAGHTFVVEHVMANGDILIAEQNFGSLSGDGASKPETWNFRLIKKATYEKTKMTFFAPSGTPTWSN